MSLGRGRGAGNGHVRSPSIRMSPRVIQEQIANASKGSLPRLASGKFPEVPTVLEVLLCKDMSFLLHVSAVMSVAAVTLVIFGVLLTRFRSTSVAVGEAIVPRYYLWFETIQLACTFVIAIIATGAYAAKVRWSAGVGTTEQLATLVLLAGTILATIPVRQLADFFATSGNHPNITLLYAGTILSTISISVVGMYVWLTTRMCRVEKQDVSERSKAYAGHMLCVFFVSFFAMFRIMGAIALNVVLCGLPFQSMVMFINTIIQERPSLNVEVSQAIFVGIVSLYEIILTVVIWNSTRKTSRFLRTAGSARYRYESISFRFFKMSSTMLYLPGLIASVVDFGYPPTQGILLRQDTGTLLLTPSVGAAGYAILLISFAIRQAYVSLPADTDGVVEWLRNKLSSSGPGVSPRHELPITSPSGRNSTSAKSLAYRETDARDPDQGFPTLDPKCFSLETASLLFNFSWLAYTFGTIGYTPSEPANHGHPEYTVVRHVVNGEHDMHAVIVNCPDRIVVAFKGSNSTANAATDRATKLIPAHYAFKGTSSPAHKALPGIHLHGQGPQWRGCQVHSGYAVAYSHMRVAIVEQVQSLYDTLQRPIFCSGHSSGGVMATLCSLELALHDTLGGPEKISAYTFGSPRTGNSKFVDLYDNLVKNHWRCVVAGDATVSVPKARKYAHVGKVALFTRTGQLTLEKQIVLRWWQSISSVYPMYKLTSYHCALASWGAVHAGKDAAGIGLWKWPLDKSTSKYFALKTRRPVAKTPKTRTVLKDVENPPETNRQDSAAVPASELEDVVAFSK